MIRRSVAVLALSTLGVAACAHSTPSPVPMGAAEVVHVAPPTGEWETDRASILAALERVRPGGTVQFAPGMYLIGEVIPVPTPRITLLGHAEGTVIRGCHPEAFPAFPEAVIACTGFNLTGGHQTVRNLTFEYMWHGLYVGCCHPDDLEAMSAGAGAQRSQVGGNRIEDNTFRYTPNGLRVIGESAAPTVVRRNRFADVYHAIGINGGQVHFLDNEITVREPHRVPVSTHPGDPINVLPFGSLQLLPAGETDHTSCTGNIVAGNRIEGYPEGIRILVLSPGTSCRHNEIRDNTIAVRRVPFVSHWQGVQWRERSDSTVFGVPIRLVNMPRAYPEWLGREGDPEADAFVEDNVVENNRVIGAEGIGIEVHHASRNRIAGNTITGIRSREHFPGNTLTLLPLWSEANGSGIWVSPGSEENEIVGNTFDDVASAAVVLEGDRNRVETRSAGETVLDLGSGNRVSGPAGAREPAAISPPSEILETGRLVFHQLLHPVGEETYTLTREGDAYLLRADFSHNDRGRTTERSVALHLGPDLAPRASQLLEIADGGTTGTAVDVNGRLATVTDASGSRQVPVPDRFFTTSAFAPHAVQALLVRYWLRNGRPDSIPILPRGNAVVRHVGPDTLEVAGETVALDRYHVAGVRWGGQTLWLDGEERLVAAVSFDFNYQAVREGYEGALAFFSERARRDALTRAEAASRLIAPLHTGTFALVGGTLIDGTGAPPLADATVVVRDGRITAVGPRASVTIPADAEVVDVTGRTLLPGLWDMHAHLAGITDFGPIYLAAGVTTVRDVGNETDWGLALREAFATGRIAGPRLLLAAEIDGRVPEAVGAIQADTPEEARALVRHFHELGFEQIKLYNRLRPELVPVITEEAHRLGMTVTGHVPWGMSLVDAVRAGVDQINHLDAVMQPMLPDSLVATGDFPRIMAAFLSLDGESAELRHLIATLLQHGTVLDLTLAAFENWWRPASVPLRDIEPGAALMPPELAAMKEGGGVPAGEAADRAAIFRKALEIVGMMHRAGVPIVAGTDVVVPGHSLHRELELYVAAGMTPLEAIRSATAVPALAMGLGHEVGTIEAGKRADLIVVDGDPLRSIREIRNVREVIANGRMFDTAALWRSVGFETGEQP